MNMFFKTSKDLDLSFLFEIIKYQNRELDIKVHGLLRDIKYSSNFFNWFMEDLDVFLSQNKFQRRWDYQLIRIYNLDSLNFALEQKNQFINKFKTITSWNMEAK